MTPRGFSQALRLLAGWQATLWEAAGVLEWVEVEEVPLAGHLLEPVIPGDRLESFGLDGIGGLDFWAVSPSQLFQRLSFPRNLFHRCVG